MKGILRIKTHEESLRLCSLSQDEENVKKAPKRSKNLRSSQAATLLVNSLTSSSNDRDNHHRSSFVSGDQEDDHDKHHEQKSLLKKSHEKLSPTTNFDSSIVTSISSNRTTLTFGKVAIREFPRVLGDNPSCCGCPIGIGWAHTEGQEISINEYEKHREGNRREVHEMKIPPEVRNDILIDWDITVREIYRRSKEMQEIQRQRSDSLRDYESMVMNNLVGCLKKPLLGTISCKKGICKKKKMKNSFLAEKY